MDGFSNTRLIDRRLAMACCILHNGHDPIIDNGARNVSVKNSTGLPLTVQTKVRPRQYLAEKTLHEPLVLIRGLGRTSGFWLDFPDSLGRAGDVFCIDLPGVGTNAEFRAQTSISGYAEVLVNALAQHNLLPCHLISISLGSMVALEMVNKLQQRNEFSAIRSLTLMATSARFTGERRLSRGALLSLARMMLSRQPTNLHIAPYLVAPETLQKKPTLPSQWDRIMREETVTTRGVLQQIWAAARFHGQNVAAAVRCPTLCLVSRADAMVSWRNTPRLWELIPEAEMRVFEELGHDLPTDDPNGVAQVICDFIAGRLKLLEAETGVGSPKPE